MFFPSSSLISSLESSSRISLESALSQNSWWQLQRSEQRILFELHLHDHLVQLLDLHSHTFRSSAGTILPSVAIEIGPSFEGFQTYYCRSTWLMRAFVVSCQIRACTTEHNLCWKSTPTAGDSLVMLSLFHHPSFWLSKLDWQILPSTSSGTLICSTAGANRKQVW